MIREAATVLEPKAPVSFVETKQIQDITERALAYLKAGFPIHLRGVSGTGKTTLAMHLGKLLERPIILLHGDEEYGTSDLVGGIHGFSTTKMVDNYIHSVLIKTENTARSWIDSRLTVACKYGYTLIYDEFTRSRPEANNVLLAVLEERILDFPPSRGGKSHLDVHPDFCAIFTSNPEEYAGVFRSQDALRDRMITLDIEPLDRETEISITAAKSGCKPREVEKVVDIVRDLREWKDFEFAPTVRACIMIAKTMKARNGSPARNGQMLTATCRDILASETIRSGKKEAILKVKSEIDRLIDKYYHSSA